MPKSQASAQPVFNKLGLKPDFKAAVLHKPKTVDLGKTPAGCSLAAKLGAGMDFLLGFYESEKALQAELPKLSKALTPAGMAWVCWRKGNVTDLSRDVIHGIVEPVGLETVSSISIDDEWSALKLMRPKDQRKAK